MDERWFHVAGGGGIAEVTDDAIYFVLSLRNVGSGIAVLHGWRLEEELRPGAPRPPLDGFIALSRDLYVPAGDIGFWQGTFRDPAAPAFASARELVRARDRIVVDVLYGDHEGGQRAISRFTLVPRDDGTWLASAARHWQIDRDDPRPR